MIALALAVSALASCTLGNTIDVCERKPTREKDFNTRTEGDQLLPTRNASAPMPSGGAMLVWTSVPMGARPEVRGALVSADGSLSATCDSAGEITYNPTNQYADQVALVAPAANDQLGAVVYRRHILGQHDEIWVVPINGSGCPLGDTEPKPFALAVGPDGGTFTLPSAAAMSDGSIAVTFTSLAAGVPRPHLLVRRFKLTQIGLAPKFLPTPNSAVGDLADAISPDGAHENGVLVPMSDGAAMVYFDLEGDGYHIELARLAPDFSIRWGPLLLSEQTVPSGFLPQDISVNLAYEPDSFFITWLTGDLLLQPVVEGMFVSGDGKYLSAPRAPNGGPFRLGTGNGAIEGSVTMTGTGEGGFLAAWQEAGSGSAHADHSGYGLRAVGFDAQGAVRFSNRVCETDDFGLNLEITGDQTQPALTRLADGTVVAAWQSKGGDDSDRDRDGFGLKTVGLSLRELFPLK